MTARALLYCDSALLVGRALGVRYLRESATEPYVSVPPALIITEPNGATWTLGVTLADAKVRDWEDGTPLESKVLRNDIDTGEYASVIERRGNKICVFGHHDGRPEWKTWNENRKYFV